MNKSNNWCDTLIKIDPRIKLVWLLSSGVVYFTLNVYLILTVLFCSLLFFILSKSHKTIYFTAFLYSLVFFLLIFAIGFSELSILNNIIILARWFAIIFASIVFFVITDPYEIIIALRTFKVPESFTFSLGMGFRFVPIIIEETEKVILAQKSRGLNYGRGLANIYRIPFIIYAISIPLFIRIIFRVNEMLLALKTKGFAFKRRRRSYPVKISFLNILITIYSFSIILAAIFLPVSR